MFQLSDGRFTNKNGGIPWYKEVEWLTKTVFEGYNSTDKGMDKGLQFV